MRLPVTADTTAKKTIVSDLIYALLSAGRYEEAVNQLLARGDDAVKSTYQAVVLSAWIDDLPLYNQALRKLLRNADPRVHQHFVYLINGMSLAPHNLSIESLTNSLDRLPQSLANNSLIQRGQLAFAIFRADKLQVLEVLSKLPKSGLPLPIRIYAKMALSWANSQPITENDLQQLRRQLNVLPSLESGNPGRSWDERCLLDLLLRRLQLSKDPSPDGGDDD